MAKGSKCRFLGKPVGACGPDCLRKCGAVPSHGAVRHSGFCQECPDYARKSGLQLPQVDDRPQLESRVVGEEETPKEESSEDVLPGDPPDGRRPRRRRSSKKSS